MSKSEIHSKNHPILAITLGEPAGIGPDIFLKMIQFPRNAHLIVFGCPKLLLQRAKKIGIEIKLNYIDNSSNIKNQDFLTAFPQPFEVNIVPILSNTPVQPGLLSVENSPYVLSALKQATDACLQSYCDAIVTGPVHKDILRQYDDIFIDQTHFISAQCNMDYQQVMMGFISPGMRLALGTLHEPINLLSQLLTPKLIEQKISCFAKALSSFFKIAKPKIGVLGFNPHCGENGLIGQEEQQVLIPCIQKLNQIQNKYQLSALLSPDSAFIASNRAQYDGFLAWYHDQGLGPFKTLYEQQAATILFGLPILRTSVDHGTALNLAGTNLADPSSFAYAIQLATTLVNNHKQ